MAMGIVSQSDIELELERLNSNSNPKSSVEIITTSHGRNKGDTNIPRALRNLVAEEAISGTPVTDIARVFDVSPSSISAYKNGATSTASYNEPDEELTKNNRAVKSDLANMAKSKIKAALEEITSDKLRDAKVKDLSGIARDMSVVVRNLEPEAVSENEATKLIIYAPQIVNENNFEVIKVKE